jgi:acetyl-CoA carboxylase carboxyltransferase component
MQVAVSAGVRGAVDVAVRPIGDRPCVVIEVSDPGDSGSRVDAAGAATIARAAELALAERLPLVGIFGSTSAELGDGVAALHGWGLAARAVVACSGIVPILAAITGPATAGPALLLGLADHAVMTEEAVAFMSGPAAVAQMTGIVIDRDELGGAAVHARHTGSAALVVPDRTAALDALALLLEFLPDHTDVEPPMLATDDPPDRPTPEAAAVLPRSSTGSYDVRSVVKALVDDGEMLELRPRFAANLVTAFARIDGRPVGIVANQPVSLAGTLDIPASQKGARFVAFCDAFNLPIITLVDTPGFYPGKDLEWRGMIRHGAQLVFAYARASVPRICLILRKSYGGAYIVMDSKTMGNDLCIAWPGAELAVMGAGQAAAILRRRATPEERAEFEADYTERLLNPYVAADRGLVDDVIDPADTRRVLSSALAALGTKREVITGRKHDNSPL